MWDIVWVSPQGHRSGSVSHHFLLHAPQCPCSVRKRFSRDHCCRGRSKPGCQIMGSHTRWELTTWADFWCQLVASPATTASWMSVVLQESRLLSKQHSLTEHASELLYLTGKSTRHETVPEYCVLTKLFRHLRRVFLLFFLRDSRRFYASKS